jgi:hypothetical protein
MISGQCLCGAVTVDVAAMGDGLSACHCDMCRVWTGVAFTAVHAQASDVTFSGPVKTRDTSEWARRGWCDDCGSTLFYQTQDDGSYGLSTGLFPDAAQRPVTIEYFSELTPHGLSFAGPHRRLNTKQTLAYFGAPEGDE